MTGKESKETTDPDEEDTGVITPEDLGVKIPEKDQQAAILRTLPLKHQIGLKRRNPPVQ